MERKKGRERDGEDGRERKRGGGEGSRGEVLSTYGDILPCLQ